MNDSKSLLIACALKKEADTLREALGTGAEIFVTGLGTDRTLRSLERRLDEAKPGLILFTGMAGQLDPSVELGEFVFPAHWAFESGTRFAVPAHVAGFLRGRGHRIEGGGVTVRRPVVRAAARLKLFEKLGARICDMESAAALMIAESYGVPCLAAKVVSDTKDSGMLAFYRHFNRNIDRLAEELTPLIADLTELPPPAGTVSV